MSRTPASPLLEMGAVAELVGFAQLAPVWALMPRGRERTVLVLPGFVADDLSTMPLRHALRVLGHDPHGWGLGRNVGATQAILDGLVELLKRTSDRARGPVPLVGWSLGGLFARWLAQRHPDLIDQVISLGSPINLSARDRTNTDAIVTDLQRHHDRFVYVKGSVDLDRVPVPSTSVFTTTDGVVPWRSCLQTATETADNVGVYGTHSGLGVNTSVLFLVAEQLTKTKRNWSCFIPPVGLDAFYSTSP